MSAPNRHHPLTSLFLEYVWPTWTDDAVTHIGRLERSGIRIRALKLTRAQLDDLDELTGQTRTLFGYPVAAREP